MQISLRTNKLEKDRLSVNMSQKDFQIENLKREMISKYYTISNRMTILEESVIEYNNTSQSFNDVMEKSLSINKHFS